MDKLMNCPINIRLESKSDSQKKIDPNLPVLKNSSRYQPLQLPMASLIGLGMRRLERTTRMQFLRLRALLLLSSTSCAN